MFFRVMGAACSALGSDVVVPIFDDQDNDEVVYRKEPVVVVGVRGIRDLRVFSEYSGKKYVGDSNDIH